MMDNIELFLLEEEVDYYESKYMVLVDELMIVEAKVDELIKANEVYESLEIQNRMYERKERMNTLRSIIESVIRVWDRKIERLTLHISKARS